MRYPRSSCKTAVLEHFDFFLLKDRPEQGRSTKGTSYAFAQLTFIGLCHPPPPAPCQAIDRPCLLSPCVVQVWTWEYDKLELETQNCASRYALVCCIFSASMNTLLTVSSHDARYRCMRCDATRGGGHEGGGGGQQKQSNNPLNNQHNLNMPTTGRR